MASPKSGVSRFERVSFEYEGRTYVGKVRTVFPELNLAFIDCDDHEPLFIPPDALKPIPKAVQAGADPDRLRFRANDRVRFELHGETVTGTIGRLNPKRAVVILDGGREYTVPYSLLEPENPGAPMDDTARRLEKITILARRLMEEHGLDEWEFRFDDGRKRAGCCNHTYRTIGLSLAYTLRAPDDHIRDTLLHEIAHALAGPDHHHDAHWRSIAERIGGSGKRCHGLPFTPPRYIVTCENRCWYATAERRRRHIVCAQCGGPIQYATFTEERWAEVKPNKAAGA